MYITEFIFSKHAEKVCGYLVLDRFHLLGFGLPLTALCFVYYLPKVLQICTTVIIRHIFFVMKYMKLFINNFSFNQILSKTY